MLQRQPAFTLSELLIALGILGVIATFTIPKVLQSQQDGKSKAIAKEAAAMISEAYTIYKMQNTPPSTMIPGALTPYLNYVKYDTSSTMDDRQNAGNLTCSSSEPCIRLHNGALLYFYNSVNFGGTNPTNLIWLKVDPDGKVTDGTTNGPGKSVALALYYSGRVTTVGTLLVGSASSNGAETADPTKDPPWFSWN